MTGREFELQFFKGCTLHCFWCHNPETLHADNEFRYVSSCCMATGEQPGSKTGYLNQFKSVEQPVDSPCVGIGIDRWMYVGLIVRVTGYSAYFTELDKNIQDEVIMRAASF